MMLVMLECISTPGKLEKVVGSIPTVVRHIFKLARCGYTLE